MTQPSAASGGIINTEPVIVFLTGLAGIVDLGLIAADGLDWVYLTNEQTAAIVAFVTAATALIAGVLRAKVWAPASVAAVTRGPVL
jgi:hypothetical protein